MSVVLLINVTQVCRGVKLVCEYLLLIINKCAFSKHVFLLVQGNTNVFLYN